VSAREVQFWDVTNGKLLREFRTDPLQVTSFAMAPGGKQFAAAGWHPWVGGKPGLAEVRILDVASGKTLRTLARPDRNLSSTHLAFSPDGRLLFSVGYSGIFRVEEIASGKELLQKKMPNDYVAGLAVSADGKHVAVASGRNSQKLFLWKWDEEEPRELQGSIRTTGLSSSPDGKRLAAVSEFPERLHVWDVLSR